MERPHHIGDVYLSRIIKSVALDDQSAKIAESLPNFSHFVRECLFRHAVHTTLECTRERDFRGTDRCNPFHQPVCFVCWPHGSPGAEAIKQFSADGLNTAFLDHKAKERNSYLIDLKGINSRSVQEKPKSPETLGFFASIRKKIRDRSP